MDLSGYPSLKAYMPGDRPLSEITIEVMDASGFATVRRGLTSAVISPGRITEDAREWYGYGFAHVLAGALHEVSGWPLAMVGRTDPWGVLVQVVHLGVTTRDGRFVDVYGARGRDAVLAAYAEFGEPDAIRETTWSGLRSHLCEHHPSEPRLQPSWRGHCNEIIQDVVHLMARLIIDEVIGGRA